MRDKFYNRYWRQRTPLFIICPLRLCLLILTFGLLVLNEYSQALKIELVARSEHADFIKKVIFSHDGKMFATASWDKTIKLWDSMSGEQLRTLSESPEIHQSLAFTSDDSKLSVVSGNEFKTWDVASGKLLTSWVVRGFLTQADSAVISDDGHLMAIAGGMWTVTGKTRINGYEVETGKLVQEIGIYETESGKSIQHIKGLAPGITALAFSYDNKILAVGNADKTIKLLDTTNGLELLTLTGQNSGINSLAFSPDGKLLASASGNIPDTITGDKNVKLWETKTGKILNTLTGYGSAVNWVMFSPDGKLLASDYGSRIRLTEVESGQEITILEGQTNFSSAAFSPIDNALLSSDFDKTIKLWNTENGKELRNFRVNSSTVPVSSVAVNSDGKTLAIAGVGGILRLWKNGEELGNFGQQSGDNGEELGNFWPRSEILRFAAKFSPDGKSLAEGTRLWDLDKAVAHELITFKKDTQSPVIGNFLLSTDLSPDGKLLATAGGDEDTSLKLWNAATGSEIKRFKDTSEIDLVAFSPNGKVLAGKSQYSIRLWDLEKMKVIQTFKSDDKILGEFYSVAFSPDGKLLASGGLSKVKIWDIKSGKELQELLGQRGQIQSLVFSPDGKNLASGGDDTIALWGIEEYYREIVSGHTNTVNALAYSPDGKTLYSGSSDTTTKIWDVPSKKEICSLMMLGKDGWLATTPEGLFDGSPNAWKSLIWRFDNNTFTYVPIEAFFKEFYRPGLLQDVFAGKNIEPPEKDLNSIDIRQPLIEIGSIDAQPTGSSDPLSTVKKTVKVKIDITDNNGKGRRNDFPASGGAADLRLFRNGSLVRLWENDAFKLGEKDGCRQFPATKDSPKKAVCEADVQITSGENEFTAYAFNHDNVKSYDASASVRGDFPKRDGTFYILAVGVNEYSNSGYNLQYAVPDARDLSAELKLQQQNLGVYKDQKIILLRDEEATKANILYALERFSKGDGAKPPSGLKDELKENLSLIKISEPEDAILVYFSGHGFADRDRFYLIPHDLGVTEEVEKVNEQKLQALREHSISDIELEERFLGVDAGQFVLIIDACNSGQALETSEEKRRGPMNSRGLAQLAYEKGMYILTASESFQFAREVSDLKHGLLTYSLLEGMKKAKDNSQLKADKDQNGQVFEREWFTFATETVPQLLDKRYKGRSSVSVAEKGDKRAEVQTPRVFYRREADINQLVIAGQ